MSEAHSIPGRGGAVPAGDPDDAVRVERADTDRSIGDLFREMSTELSTLFRQEVQLAQAEIRQELQKAGQAAAAMAAAAVVGLVTLFLLAWTIAHAIGDATFTWLGFLITTLLFGAIAAVLFVTGRKRVQQVNLKPDQTIETVREDAQMIKERT